MGASDEGEGEGTPERTVPYARLQQKNEELRELRAELARREAEMAPLREAAARVAALEAEVQRGTRYRALAAAGIIDPDIGEALEYAYSRLPAEGRPEFQAALKGWLEDPATAPAIARAFLGGGGGGGGAGNRASAQHGAGTAATAQGTAGTAGTGARPPGPAGAGSLDPVKMAMAGDREGYARHREQILAQLGRRP